MKQSTKIKTENSSHNRTYWYDGKDNQDRPCIWMQAGVVGKKSCNHFYDCTSCKYDTVMGNGAMAGKHPGWQDAMRQKDSTDRTCRHALTRRTEHRTCPMNYNCDRCDFDQLFEDTLSCNTGHAKVTLKDIDGFKLADGYRFHQGHTWTTLDSGGFIRVGMDDFTFKVLGGPDAFDFPMVGQELNQNKPGWGMKRKQNLADILSPVDGVITKVNSSLFRSPDIAKDQPYESGWLFTVHHPDLKGAVKSLMATDESEQWLGREITALEEMIEETAGPMSTDGGLIYPDVFGSLPEIGWSNLTRRFLKTPA